MQINISAVHCLNYSVYIVCLVQFCHLVSIIFSPRGFAVLCFQLPQFEVFGQGPPPTPCRKCQNRCEGHRSVPRNVQLSAPPPKAASGSGHQKSESYKTQFESQSQRNIHLKRIKAIDRASQKYQWVSVFVQRSLTVEDHLVRLQQLWKREDNCTQCRYQNRAHRSHLFWHFLHGVGGEPYPSSALTLKKQRNDRIGKWDILVTGDFSVLLLFVPCTFLGRPSSSYLISNINFQICHLFCRRQYCTKDGSPSQSKDYYK